MKKRYWAAPVALVLSVFAVSATAATIDNLSGQSCGSFSGAWHFVNNQVPAGSGAGQLTAYWSSGDQCVVGASKINGSTQHFNCTASGTLLGASTTLGGKLVLSDFSCETKEEPPCDPKKEVCPK